MKKGLKIIVLVVLVIGLIFGIYKLASYKEPPFDIKIEFSPKYTVINQTKIPYLDTIVQAGLISLNSDSVNIRIFPLEIAKNIQIQGVDLKAFVTGTGSVYVIYIEDSGRSKDIEILSHELVHLKQYQDKRLVINGQVSIWLGDTLNIKSYNDRPWEIEAFRKQGELDKNIRKLLYN